MCKDCGYKVEAAAWMGAPAALARNRRLYNIVTNNQELLEKLMGMAKKEVDATIRTWESNPELMLQVLQTLTGRPLLTADKNTELLNQFKDNIGTAYRWGLNEAPGTPGVIPRLIEESVKDNVFKFVTRLDEDTRRDLGGKLSEIIQHNREADQIDRLLPRDVANELSKVLDGNTSRAEAIARTETMRSANLASWASAKAGGSTHFVVDSSFEACEECADTYEGEVFLIDDTDNLPPLHPNCACVPMFISQPSEGDELSRDMRDRNEGERLVEEEKGKVIDPRGSGAYYPED